jgi:hypothetical protein
MDSSTTASFQSILLKLETRPEISDYETLNSFLKNDVGKSISFTTLCESVPRLLELYQRDIEQTANQNNSNRSSTSEKWYDSNTF